MNMKNDMNRFVSKLTASMLVVSCVLLSSPGVLLAQALPVQDPLSADAVAQEETSSLTLDVQPIQPAESTVDTATLAPDEPVLTPQLSVDPPVDTTQALNNDPSSSNLDTGSDSQNDSTADVNNNTDITNNNYAEVFNDSFLQANTGSNNANYNTGSGIITTNKAEGDGQLLNVINKNSTQIGGSGLPSPDIANNENTGSNSENTSQTNINNELTVKNINEANVINRVTADINSGNNNTNFNTGHGMITTGQANLGLNFFSIANANLFGSQKFYANLQNIYNNYTGNINLSNELASGSSPLSNLLLNASNNSTGQNSSNQAIVNINDETSINNQNTGSLNNEIDATVVSGQNKANYNTGTGSVVSGTVNSSVNVINFLNSNITSGNWMVKTLNVFGNWEGDLTLPSMELPDLAAVVSPSDSGATNSNTGAGSDNSTDSNINNSTTITNDNTAVIENNVTIRTDSGSNDASYNGGSGIVKIGSARAETNEMNVANLNVTGNSWWLIVVNRFGNWNGTAVGSPEAVAIKTTGIATVLTPSHSGVNVVNNSTGPESDNSAGVNINHTTDITNTNQADITNTVDIQAISGENETKYNTGHGYVETGDIRGANNIINFANSNITVGNWVVVVVNVFGNWDGDLVFNTPGGGGNLDVGGSLDCPIFDSSSSITDSSNNTTGSGSQNNSSSSANSNTSATNNNNADLNNTTDISSTTGQNDANYNTGDGSISTGGAGAGSSVSNQANSNNVSADSSGGGGSSQNGNDTTGSGSTNNSSSTDNSDTSATNNNDTTVNNDISGSTNTGQNSSSYNTGSGSIDTSWANTFLDLRNQVNDNEITLGDLADDFNQAPVAPGSQTEIPNDNSSTQTCPGVTIEVMPATVSIQTGGTQTFTAVAKDPAGNIIAVQPAFTWTATGGTIDESGVYTAGGTAGSFAVTATASYGNQGSAAVTITDPSNNGGGGSSSGGGGGGGGGGSSSGGGGGGGGISLLTIKRIKGDFNKDGKVDDLDFSILMAGWGIKRIGLIAEDSGEGVVGDPDFSIVMSNWTMPIKIAALANIF